MEDEDIVLFEEREIYIPKRFPRAYQLSDVLYNSNPVKETIREIRSQKGSDNA